MALISTCDLRWLNHAVQHASVAPHDKWRVGAVLVRRGRVLSTGVNRYRNHPAQVSLEGVSYHAEEVAIRKAGDAEGATIYVARITKSGLIGKAMPCERCRLMLSEHGVHTAVWTEVDGWGRSRIRELVLA
jgi:cytidine deaminase